MSILFHDQQLCACLLAVHLPNTCSGPCGSRSAHDVLAKTLPLILILLSSFGIGTDTDTDTRSPTCRTLLMCYSDGCLFVSVRACVS